MRDDDEPERLSRGSNPDLRAALREMAGRRPTPARVTRIANNVALVTGLPASQLQPASIPADSPAPSPPNPSSSPPPNAPIAAKTLTIGTKVAAVGTFVIAASAFTWWVERTEPHRAERDPAGLAAPPPPASRSPSALRAPPAPPPLRSQAKEPRPSPSPAHPSQTADTRDRNLLQRDAERQSTGAPVRSPSSLSIVDSRSSRPKPAIRRHSGSAIAEADSTDKKARARTAPTSDELGVLRLAQDALQTSPLQALRLTEQHRAEFPRSAASQERELIEIAALVRLRRSAEAQARAARFRSAHPASAYERQLQMLLPRE